MEFSEYNWATISETICRERLIFIHFYDIITLVLYIP